MDIATKKITRKLKGVLIVIIACIFLILFEYML